MSKNDLLPLENSLVGASKSGGAIKDSDFIGFTFGKDHSSSFHILRVSDGSRYNDNLLPTMQDKTIPVPGGDGAYYYGSYYNPKNINIAFAFDSMTESDYRGLRQWLGDRKIKDLIFDDCPYKVYKAKVTGSATIKHICFFEKGQRIYKGEGNIQFTCYYPFAHTPKGQKFLENYSTYNNVAQWGPASGMKQSNGGAYDTFSGNSINLFNPGDMDTNFCLNIAFSEGKIPSKTIAIVNDSERQLQLKDITRKSDSDQYIRINTKTNLIEGLDSSLRKTGTLYNEYVKGGNFFLIPQGESKMSLDSADGTVTIDYDYLYF